VSRRQTRARRPIRSARGGRLLARLVLTTLVLAALACGGTQTHLGFFSTDWEDDGGASITRVWQRVGSTAIAPQADVVVGVAGHGDKLVGLSLGEGSKWTFQHVLDARPMVSGNVVVGSGAGEVFALDARTGALVWRRTTAAGALVGAGDDGSATVLTYRQAGGIGSVLLAVARDGHALRQIETTKSLGVPAVLGRMAFVPWAGQYVSVIDLESGEETARVTLRAATSRAWTDDGALWFGESSFIRFDERIGGASRGKASVITLPARELPGRPRLMPAGNEPVAAAANADDKTRIYARPVAGETLAFEDGRSYATYYRIAMGFDAGRPSGHDDAGKLVWARLHPVNFVGGAVAHGGIVLCDEQGKVTALDARDGGVVSEADLGEPVQACVVSMGEQRFGRATSANKGLAAQLAETVLADDPQLVVAQRLLLRELAVLEDESATKALLDLASDPRTSPDLVADARTALAGRRNGVAYMEAALARHYDFLKDVLRPPPVGPIAQALGAIEDKAAASLLAAHLLDPADTDDDVMRAAAAMAVIAGPGEVPALRQFFGMYRATAADDDVATAVVSVGQALLDLDDTAGRALVDMASKDPSTVPYARERLQALESDLSRAHP
jgi:outer membrane protein assembly factor BamB